MRTVSIVLGLIGIAGTVSQVDLGFGVDGMERVAVFPLPIWAFVAGPQALRAG